MLQNCVTEVCIPLIECTVYPLPYGTIQSFRVLCRIITNTLQYNMIGDPLLKILVIPLHHVIEYIIIDFARVYIWYIQEGISLPVKD